VDSACYIQPKWEKYIAERTSKALPAISSVNWNRPREKDKALSGWRLL